MTQLPFDQAHPLAPPTELRALQQAGGVHPVRTAVGDPAWLVTSYDLVKRLLSDERLGRGHPAPDTASRTGKSALFGGPLGEYATEKSDHARMRALLQPHFTPKRMRDLRPRVEELTRSLLDDLTSRTPPADLVEALAVPLPILVICELLGVPYDDRDEFRAWTDEAADTSDHDRSLHGIGQLFQYGTRLVEHKRDHPADDVITRIALDDDVTTEEAAGLAMALLFAGHETTVVHIGLAALHLLADPEQWHAIVEHPDRIPRAVEEALRTAGQRGGGIPRYARTDLDLDGTTVTAGDLVLLDTGTANHDPAVFPDPDSYDHTRNDAPHLAFGHGLRFCIGAPLARIELHTVLHQLARRIPTLQLATPVDQLTTRTDQLVGGLTALPVTW